MQSLEDFKKDIATGGVTLQKIFDDHVAQGEQFTGDKESLLWNTYTRNRDLQKKFLEEVHHAVSMPELAAEVIGMRFRLWQEFVESVNALGSSPAPVEEEQDLTVYKDKHPAPPREDELTVAPKPFVRVKPKPTFTAPRPVQKVGPKPATPPVEKKVVEKPKKQVETMERRIAVTPEDIEKIRKNIIERVGKNAQGFLDGIFGSLGNDDAGLSKVQNITLADIIAIERLSPDAHTAKLDDLGVTQKEWEGWIDWVNESNRVVPAAVTASLGEYVDMVAHHIAGKK